MTTALSLRLTLSWRAMNAFTASVAETFFSRINCASLVADIQMISSDLSVEVTGAGAALAEEELMAAMGRLASKVPAELSPARRRKSRRLLRTEDGTEARGGREGELMMGR